MITSPSLRRVDIVESTWCLNSIIPKDDNQILDAGMD